MTSNVYHRSLINTLKKLLNYVSIQLNTHYYCFSDDLLKVSGVILKTIVQHVSPSLSRDQGGLHAQVPVSAAHQRADQRAMYTRRGAERACLVRAFLS